LRLLIESPERRRAIGSAAYEDIRENHTTRAMAPVLARALEEQRQGSRSRVSGVGRR